MNLIDRLRFSLARPILQKMARQLLPIISPWKTATFLDADFPTLDAEAYKGNSAVFACTSVLSFGFIEPSLRVYDAKKEEIVTHPTRKLVIRPNDIMGEGELFLHTITYMAIGGNAFWHKVRNGQRQVIALKPYHIGNILPVPGRGDSWIERYDFDDGTGHKTPIDKEDIVHFKWPSVDMYQPWMAMPPLLPALREVATDNEAIRFLKAVLQNDAVPRMVMYVPPESNLDLDDPEKIERFKAQFRQKYGGDSRGNLAIITGGAKVERISLNMEELNFDAISRIPESRISADLRVPAMLAGLNTGMARSTFNNTSEAREFFTRNTLSALWKLSASEIAADTDLNPNGDTINFDMNEVQVLQEDANNKWARLQNAFNSGAITFNDFLSGVGLPALDSGGDVRLMESSKVMVDLATMTFTPVSAPPPPPEPPKPLLLPAPADDEPIDDQSPAGDGPPDEEQDGEKTIVKVHKNGSGE